MADACLPPVPEIVTQESIDELKRLQRHCQEQKRQISKETFKLKKERRKKADQVEETQVNDVMDKEERLLRARIAELDEEERLAKLDREQARPELPQRDVEADIAAMDAEIEQLRAEGAAVEETGDAHLEIERVKRSIAELEAQAALAAQERQLPPTDRPGDPASPRSSRASVLSDFRTAEDCDSRVGSRAVSRSSSPAAASVCTEAPGSARAAAESGKVVGKASGKGAGAPPPPPPIPGKGKGKGDKQAVKESARAKLRSLRWKATHQPEAADCCGGGVDLLEKLARTGPEVSGEACPGLPPRLSVPSRPDTVFGAVVTVPDLPLAILETYFTERENTIKLPAGGDAQDRGVQHHLDDKRLQNLGIMLSKLKIKLKTTAADKNRASILDLKQRILQCSLDVEKEDLSVVRELVGMHRQDEESGMKKPDQWSDLEYADYYRLVDQLVSIPAIDERLECMIIMVTFAESFETCKKNLEVSCKALDMLQAKQDVIKKFFGNANRLVQSLSRDAGAGAQGFPLSALEKLAQTKCTKFKDLSILHFVLALMSPQDREQLFTADDIQLLHHAKAIKTQKVYQECNEMVQNFRDVKGICFSGKYTRKSTNKTVTIDRRRKSMPPSALQEAEIDTDDCFHDRLNEFVLRNESETNELGLRNFFMILEYKKLALFFDDLKSVWPPPKDEKDPTRDLVEVFYKCATNIKTHRDNFLHDDRLRSLWEEMPADAMSSPAPPRPSRSLTPRRRVFMSPSERSSLPSGSPRTPGPVGFDAAVASSVSAR